MLDVVDKSSPSSKKLHDKDVLPSKVSTMDEQEPAREIVVATIATLETLIDALMTAQSPSSTKKDIEQAALSLRETAGLLVETADEIEASLPQSQR